MVWFLALEFEAPGMLNRFDPKSPEPKAEFCEYVFPVEIAVLKQLIDQTTRSAMKPSASDERNSRRSMAALENLQRQFVGDESALLG
jgi:hypothetical protein